MDSSENIVDETRSRGEGRGEGKAFLNVSEGGEETKKRGKNEGA